MRVRRVNVWVEVRVRGVGRHLVRVRGSLGVAQVR